MDNDEIVGGQGTAELSAAETRLTEVAVNRVMAIVALLEHALNDNVPVLPAADMVDAVGYRTFAAGWGKARDACLHTLTEVRTAGERYEASLVSLGVKDAPGGLAHAVIWPLPGDGEPTQVRLFGSEDGARTWAAGHCPADGWQYAAVVAR